MKDIKYSPACTTSTPNTKHPQIADSKGIDIIDTVNASRARAIKFVLWDEVSVTNLNEIITALNQKCTTFSPSLDIPSDQTRIKLNIQLIWLKYNVYSKISSKNIDKKQPL